MKDAEQVTKASEVRNLKGFIYSKHGSFITIWLEVKYVVFVEYCIYLYIEKSFVPAKYYSRNCNIFNQRYEYMQYFNQCIL